MENELIQILRSLGLTEKESKVYLACTELGTCAVSKIAQKAKINRVTTYDILEKLKGRGLVSFYTKKKVRYFSSTNPELLLEQFEKRTNDLRTALPKFKRLTGETNHPRIRYFEGLDGIKAIYADTLTSKTEILNFSNSIEIREQWPNYDKEYVAKRAKKKIFLKGICPNDNVGKRVHDEDEKYQREMRLIPADTFKFTNEINIYDDKVSIISFKDELIGMIIESSEIANSQRAIFDMCWQYAELLQNGDVKNIDDIKTKMMTPLSEREVRSTIKKTEPQSTNTSEKDLKDNLSLF